MALVKKGSRLITHQVEPDIAGSRPPTAQERPNSA